jgi:esterase
MTLHRHHLAALARASGLQPGEVVSPDEHDVVADGLRLHYLDWGTPAHTPVVFLHGGGLNAHTWDIVCLAVRRDYRCYAVDLRGHGDSEWSPTLEYGLDAHLRDLEAFVDHLGADRLFLVGHSLGGFLAIRYASLHSQRLAGLVVVDANPFVRGDEPAVARVRDFMLGRATFDSVEEAVDYALTLNPKRDRRLLRSSLEQALRRGPDGRWTWKRDQRHLSPQYFADVATEARALVADVPAIRCPTLFVRGGDSDACAAKEAAEFMSLVGNGQVVTVEGAGHNVQGDNPAGLLGALRPFLDENTHTVLGPASASTERDSRRGARDG